MPTFKCPYCAMKGAYAKNLKRHVRNYHPEREAEFHAMYGGRMEALLLNVNNGIPGVGQQHQHVPVVVQQQAIVQGANVQQQQLPGVNVLQQQQQQLVELLGQPNGGPVEQQQAIVQQNGLGDAQNGPDGEQPNGPVVNQPNGPVVDHPNGGTVEEQPQHEPVANVQQQQQVEEILLVQQNSAQQDEAKPPPRKKHCSDQSGSEMLDWPLCEPGGSSQHFAEKRLTRSALKEAENKLIRKVLLESEKNNGDKKGEEQLHPKQLAIEENNKENEKSTQKEHGIATVAASVVHNGVEGEADVSFLPGEGPLAVVEETIEFDSPMSPTPPAEELESPKSPTPTVQEEIGNDNHQPPMVWDDTLLVNVTTASMGEPEQKENVAAGRENDDVEKVNGGPLLVKEPGADADDPAANAELHASMEEAEQKEDAMAAVLNDEATKPDDPVNESGANAHEPAANGELHSAMEEEAEQQEDAMAAGPKDEVEKPDGPVDAQLNGDSLNEADQQTIKVEQKGVFNFFPPPVVPAMRIISIEPSGIVGMTDSVMNVLVNGKLFKMTKNAVPEQVMLDYFSEVIGRPVGFV